MKTGDGNFSKLVHPQDNLTLVLRDPYRSGFAMHVCVAGYGSIRDRPVSSFTL